MLSLHLVKAGHYFDVGSFYFDSSKYWAVLSKTRGPSEKRGAGLLKFLINSLK